MRPGIFSGVFMTIYKHDNCRKNGPAIQHILNLLFRENLYYMTKRKILIADDDYDITASILAILRNKGHDVVTAGNGEEALVKFYEFKPEIVLLDLMMEKFDSGVTVCKKIRETDKNVKIYLISAAGDGTADLAETHDMGFNGAVAKPVTQEKLMELVNLD